MNRRQSVGGTLGYLLTTVYFSEAFKLLIFHDPERVVGEAASFIGFPHDTPAPRMDQHDGWYCRFTRPYANAPTPLTFVVITLLLTTVVRLECWINARRATRVDPLIALRWQPHDRQSIRDERNDQLIRGLWPSELTSIVLWHNFPLGLSASRCIGAPVL